MRKSISSKRDGGASKCPQAGWCKFLSQILESNHVEPRVPVCLGQWGRGSLQSLQPWYWTALWFGSHLIKVEEETIPASQGTFRGLGHSFCKEEAAERSGQRGTVMRLSSDFRIE